MSLYQSALESARKNSTDRETLALALAESGRSRLGAGNGTEAEDLLREALAIREVEMPQHWRTAETRSLLGGALLAQRRIAEAAPLLRSGYEAMARSTAAVPLVDRPRLAEVEAWKAERARLAAGGPKP